MARRHLNWCLKGASVKLSYPKKSIPAFLVMQKGMFSDVSVENLQQAFFRKQEKTGGFVYLPQTRQNNS